MSQNRQSRQIHHWIWQLLTHPRVAETVLFLFALGVIVTLSANPASAETTTQPGAAHTIETPRFASGNEGARLTVTRGNDGATSVSSVGPADELDPTAERIAALATSAA